MGPDQRRATAFARWIDDHLCTRIEPWRWGTLYVDERFPSMPDVNFLSVEGAPAQRLGGVVAEAERGVVAEAERVLAAAAIPHRRVVAADAVADLLVPVFAEAGWRAERYRLMVQRRQPGPTTGAARVEEVGLEDYLRFRDTLDPGGRTEVRDAFARELDRRVGTRCFLASLDDRRVSACVVWAHGADAQLDGVATLPAFRGRGAASAVVAAAADAARSSGASWIHLYTRADTGPILLYRRLGFEDAGEIVDLVADGSPQGADRCAETGTLGGHDATEGGRLGRRDALPASAAPHTGRRSRAGGRMAVADDLPKTTGDEEPATLGSGVRYAWGRSGDAYSIWRTRDGKVVAAFDTDQGETSARVGFQALETVARRRRRRLQVAVVFVVLVVTGAVAAGMVVTRSDAPANAGATDARRFRDPGNAYTFLYPAGWAVHDESGTTTVTSPDGAVEVSVATAAPGDPTAVAQGAAVAAIQGWTHTSIEDPQYRHLGALRAASVSVTGEDQDGTPERLVTFVVPRGQGNVAVTIVVHADASPDATTPGIERIVSSFRLL